MIDDRGKEGEKEKRERAEERDREREGLGIYRNALQSDLKRSEALIFQEQRMDIPRCARRA